MIDCVPTIDVQARVEDVLSMLRQKTKGFETVNYVYVLNKKGILVGVISVKDVFRLKSNKTVRSIIRGQNLVFVYGHTDQEKIVRLALKIGLKSLPVLDKNRKFLGVVTHKTILKILETEHIEDLFLGAGVSHVKSDITEENFSDMSSFLQFKKRIPWLIFGLLGGIMTAVVVTFFEESLRAEIIFASFIPLVVYIADAVGVQTQTIFIRELVVDKELNVRKYARTEGKVTLGLAVCLGLMIYFITMLWRNSNILGIVIGLAVFSTILISSLVAILLPWIFNKIKVDPAVASGPFATVIRDITSLMVYFGIANLLYFRVFI